MTKMRSKRLHESLETSSEKSGKRTCFDGSTLSNTSGVTSPPASETDDQESPPPGNDAHPQTGLHSAAHPDHPEQSVILCDQADHENQHATETGNSQSLILIQRTSVCDQQGSLAGTASVSLNVRAVGEMLINWPSNSAGLTIGICDLKTLKLIIASDDLSDDHKAILIDRPEATRVSDVTYLQWAVTGSISRYAGRKRKWSAAHVVDLALWVGGPDAGMQAARALEIFGVWGPSGEFIMSYRQNSIKTCLEPETILPPAQDLNRKHSSESSIALLSKYPNFAKNEMNRKVITMPLLVKYLDSVLW